MDKIDDQQIFDASPYLKLFIDKEGQWFQNDAKIIHPQVYALFNEKLRKRPDGKYELALGREVCQVHVEDAPFVVQRIHTEDGGIWLELNDGAKEEFNPDNFWIGEENIPYSVVKNGRFHARFSRPAYYQIAGFIEPGEDENNFFLNVNGAKFPVSSEPKI